VFSPEGKHLCTRNDLGLSNPLTKSIAWSDAGELAIAEDDANRVLIWHNEYNQHIEYQRGFKKGGEVAFDWLLLIECIRLGTACVLFMVVLLLLMLLMRVLMYLYAVPSTSTGVACAAPPAGETPQGAYSPGIAILQFGYNCGGRGSISGRRIF
jgi:hypothetical protein